MRRIRRHTVFDAMEERGIFAQNTANVGAINPTTGESTYTGPVSYPKMLYHPQGASEIKVAGVAGPGGSVEGQQRGMVTRTVHSAAEEKRLRAEGWHEHPGDAIVAGGGQAPPRSAAEKLSNQDAQIKVLREELERVSRGEAPQLDLSQFGGSQLGEAPTINGAVVASDPRFPVGGGGVPGHDPTLDAITGVAKRSPEFQRLVAEGLIEPSMAGED